VVTDVPDVDDDQSDAAVNLTDGFDVETKKAEACEKDVTTETDGTDRDV
jgi:hypothetical protein